MRIMRIVMLDALAAILGGTAAWATAPEYLDLAPNLEKWFRTPAAAAGDKNHDLRLHTLNRGSFNGLVVQTREILLGREVISRQAMVFSRNDEGDVLFHGDPVAMFDRPVLWVDAPLEVGKVWTDTQPAAAKGSVPAGTVHYVFAVLEEQDVACPMGTFPCHRVFVATVQPDGSSTACNFWYNPHCGLVQCCLEDQSTFVLQKAQQLDRPVVPDRKPDAPDIDLTSPTGAPNPFNPATEIRFELGRELPVTVEVYDLAGRLVRRLVGAEVRAAGPQAVTWDGRDEAGRAAASGAYVARVTAGAAVARTRLMLVR